jgi:hypothetical protein
MSDAGALSLTEAFENRESQDAIFEFIPADEFVVG